MKTSILIAAMIAATATGCGSPTAARPAAFQPAPACSPRTGSTVTVTDTDNGGDICIERGARLEVYLHGSPAQTWSPIRSSGSALTPAVSGKNTLMRGVTGGFYAATAMGTATLASVLGPCTTPSASDASPTPSCGAFDLTVVVR